MRNYKKMWIVARTLCCVALAGGATLVGCKGIDDSLGLGLLPGDMQSHQGRFTIKDNFVETFVTGGEMKTSNHDLMMLGKRTSPITGVKTDASVILPYLLDEYADRGHKAVLDSLQIVITIANRTYDQSFADQIFNIYPIESFKRDSIYTNVIDVDNGFYNPTKPLYSFTISDDAIDGFSHSDKYVRIRATLKPIGQASDVEEYEKSLWADLTRSKSDWMSESDWLDKYKGFYIKSAGGDDDGLYGISTSWISVWYHNYDAAVTDEDKVKDTKYLVLNYSSTGRVTKIDYDYSSFADAGIINDTLSGASPQALCYVEPIGGMTTLVRFTDGFSQQIKKRIEDENRDGDKSFNKMIIQKASLRFAIDEDQTTNFDIMAGMHRVLGSYLNYKDHTPIYDYFNLLIDMSSVYDGGLNHTYNYYEMDLTKFVQNILNNPETAAKQFTLGPNLILTADDYGYYNVKGFRDKYLPYETALRGSASTNTPPQIEITYLLAK